MPVLAAQPEVQQHRSGTGHKGLGRTSDENEAGERIEEEGDDRVEVDGEARAELAEIQS